MSLQYDGLSVRGGFMVKKTLFRLLSLCLALILLPGSTINVLSAEDDKDKTPDLYGRVFDVDKDKEKKKEKDQDFDPLADVLVRIVNAQTGESRETHTNKSGCYKFDDVRLGTYSLSVNHEKVDFTLPDKIKMEEDKDLMACVALQYLTNGLMLVTDEHCKCEGFPFLLLVLGTPIAGAFLLTHDEEEGEEVSASRP
jgi:hypothetical protein